mgnify:CR=1 FL=1
MRDFSVFVLSLKRGKSESRGRTLSTCRAPDTHLEREQKEKEDRQRVEKAQDDWVATCERVGTRAGRHRSRDGEMERWVADLCRAVDRFRFGTVAPP